MIRFFTLFTMILLLTGVSMEGFGQTFTFNSSRPGCNGTWGDVDCWAISNSCGSGNSSAPPPTVKTSGCAVNIIIESDVTLPNNVAFGGALFRSLTVNNATLTFNGDVTINANSKVDFVTNSGEIVVNGAGGIIVSASSGNGTTEFNVKGDGLGNITTSKIDLNNDVNITIFDGGSLVTTGDTFFAGKGITMTVDGFFRTKSLRITGQNNVLRTSDGQSGTVIIEGDVDLTGGGNPNVFAGISMNGFSEMEIGGDVKVTNNSTFFIGPDASVKLCGEQKTIPTGDNIEGQFSDEPCFFILPVEFANFSIDYVEKLSTARLTWSTTKEWESSHFEIERAVKGVEFVKIGEVNAAGWSDVLMQYAFEDTALPLGESNVLYRLKQVDLTGHHHYSKVLSVKTSGVQFTSGVWRAYPNPTLDNQLRISLLDRSQYDEEPITFRLVHPTAQSQAIAVRTEMEMNEQLSQMVARIPKGIFVVEIQWGQKIEHIKVMKQ
jgi:hypothetical protein